MRVYIGGQIDHATTDPSSSFKELADVVQQAFDNKALIYNPAASFFVGKSHSDAHLGFVVDTNRQALHAADVAVFRFNDGLTVGTPTEMFECWQRGKPFFVWHEGAKEAGMYLKHMTGGALSKSKGALLIKLKDWHKEFASQSPVTSLSGALDDLDNKGHKWGATAQRDHSQQPAPVR